MAKGQPDGEEDLVAPLQSLAFKLDVNQSFIAIVFHHRLATELGTLSSGQGDRQGPILHNYMSQQNIVQSGAIFNSMSSAFPLQL